ncbi:hypothetical protein V6U89_10505 [Micromonospora sp. CPCC 206171]
MDRGGQAWVEPIADLTAFATGLAGSLATLHRIDATSGPAAESSA